MKDLLGPSASAAATAYYTAKIAQMVKESKAFQKWKTGQDAKKHQAKMKAFGAKLEADRKAMRDNQVLQDSLKNDMDKKKDKGPPPRTPPTPSKGSRSR